jgi:hypothetical protein
VAKIAQPVVARKAISCYVVHPDYKTATEKRVCFFEKNKQKTFARLDARYLIS